VATVKVVVRAATVVASATIGTTWDAIVWPRDLELDDHEIHHIDDHHYHHEEQPRHRAVAIFVI
jgi:hypothetical protein